MTLPFYWHYNRLRYLQRSRSPKRVICKARFPALRTQRTQRKVICARNARNVNSKTPLAREIEHVLIWRKQRRKWPMTWLEVLTWYVAYVACVLRTLRALLCVHKAGNPALVTKLSKVNDLYLSWLPGWHHQRHQREASTVVGYALQSNRPWPWMKAPRNLILAIFTVVCPTCSASKLRSKLSDSDHHQAGAAWCAICACCVWLGRLFEIRIMRCGNFHERKRNLVRKSDKNGNKNK